jgi:hypothetical protein
MIVPRQVRCGKWSKRELTSTPLTGHNIRSPAVVGSPRLFSTLLYSSHIIDNF